MGDSHKGRPYRDEETLRSLYWDQGLSQNQMAEELDCSRNTIRNWMKKLGVETRDDPWENRPYRDEDTLRSLYLDEGMTVEGIADRFDCSTSTIHNWMDHHGIDVRPREESMKGRNVWWWKEKALFEVSYDGYERWEDTYGGATVKVRVHRLVAVAEYGFEDVADKVVHHKNEIPWDNRPENLELMTPGEHTKHHRIWENSSQDN